MRGGGHQGRRGETNRQAGAAWGRAGRQGSKHATVTLVCRVARQLDELGIKSGKERGRKRALVVLENQRFGNKGSGAERGGRGRREAGRAGARLC